MAMDNRIGQAMVSAIEERSPNPEQVIGLLLIQI
jgi:hypothetical protein